jgi:cell division protein FtsL
LKGSPLASRKKLAFFLGNKIMKDYKNPPLIPFTKHQKILLIAMTVAFILLVIEGICL